MHLVAGVTFVLFFILEKLHLTFVLVFVKKVQPAGCNFRVVLCSDFLSLLCKSYIRPDVLFCCFFVIPHPARLLINIIFSSLLLIRNILIFVTVRFEVKRESARERTCIERFNSSAVRFVQSKKSFIAEMLRERPRGRRR